MTSSAFDSYVAENVRACAWNRLLSLSHKMLDAAHAGEWDRVVHLEADRRQRIERFFSVGIAPDETLFVRDGIIDILEADRELLRLSQGYDSKRLANVIQFRPRASAKRS